MNVTAKGRYALKIMMDLTVQCGKQQRRSIANRQGVPLDYMDHILQRLKQHQLVETVRGRGGGLTIGKDASDISVWDILTAVEDSLYPVQCLEEACDHLSSCISATPWTLVYEDMKHSLQKRSLRSMVEETHLRSPMHSSLSESEQPKDLNVQECRGPRKKPRQPEAISRV